MTEILSRGSQETTSLTVAIIALVGVLLSALITNWAADRRRSKDQKDADNRRSSDQKAEDRRRTEDNQRADKILEKKETTERLDRERKTIVDCTTRIRKAHEDEVWKTYDIIQRTDNGSIQSIAQLCSERRDVLATFFSEVDMACMSMYIELSDHEIANQIQMLMNEMTSTLHEIRSTHSINSEREGIDFLEKDAFTEEAKQLLADIVISTKNRLHPPLGEIN